MEVLVELNLAHIYLNVKLDSLYVNYWEVGVLRMVCSIACAHGVICDAFVI